ncbi:MAG: hypothetical protein HC875_17350 [Anaerolineales bacterium]|nr:hypothetical protein [Anaerolineales bacterium]
MWSEKEQQELDEILKKYPPERKMSAVLPALYLAQREKNWLDDDDIAAVSEALDLPVTHVHSVIGFYTLFRKEPSGKYMVQVCTDLPCACVARKISTIACASGWGLARTAAPPRMDCLRSSRWFALPPVIKRPVCKSIWIITRI